jgi:hypothetical protein
MFKKIKDAINIQPYMPYILAALQAIAAYFGYTGSLPSSNKNNDKK